MRGTQNQLNHPAQVTAQATENRVPQFKVQKRDTQNRPNQTAQATARATEIRVLEFKEQKKDTENRPNRPSMPRPGHGEMSPLIE